MQNVVTLPPRGKTLEQKSTVRAKAGFYAWCRVLDAIAEQRNALDYRIRCGDPADNFLEADCRTWCELTEALTDFLWARRAA